MSGTTVNPTAEQSTTGFFGKLPGRGDFIGRHLPKSFLGPWDDWLQAAIAHSRRQLGESWREYYCTSPIWRFALGPGLCGPTTYAGILIPSMDRVGRYYPLVIAAALTPSWPLFALPTSAVEWFDQAEQLALAALERDELDLDHFDRQVAALGVPSTSDFPASHSAHGDAWYWPLPQPLELTGISPLLASELLQQAFPLPSLWWTEGSDQITRCLLICKGLPPIDGFAALLAGNWPQWGWSEKVSVDIASAWASRLPPKSEKP
ncbi:MAG: type VI secretion system-associated protein TagF [Phycisphaerales bacterium]|nr:type VI secretion system-associated protein TagF [Phycisphaerales bacterium]